MDSDKFYAMPNKPGHFVAGDIVRPHLLTTAIGQASIATESIDHYLRQEAPGKRPKVDVHHFNLLQKLKETHLEPEKFDAGDVEEQRGTASGNWAIHNYEDRSGAEIITTDNCVVFCPQDAVFRVKKDKSTTGRYVDTDYDRCIGCHICSDVCPTGYIDMALGH
jgi:Pyruvate/2-oxoacid:ferredoxin oxidoreductase delta subunit